MVECEGMVKELWNAFPRLLEEKINALLDEAEPNPMKAFQLYKTCQNEGLWSQPYESFSEVLEKFFSLSKIERRKSDLDALLERPLSADLFESFQLTFRNAVVNNKSLLDIASWAHHLLRLNRKTDSSIISPEVLTKTLRTITNPPLWEKAQNIEFEDFCQAWKKTVFTLFGKKYDAELQDILNELRWLHQNIQEEIQASTRTPFVPTIYLTQTEIDWTLAVEQAVSEDLALPKYPLSRGPQKQRLIDLERTVKLYKIVQTTRLPELLEQKNNIRATILDRCAKLLKERAR
ncbi:MAG: hypothetical protein AAGB31_08000 [Bdellovibrio sp.]